MGSTTLPGAYKSALTVQSASNQFLILGSAPAETLAGGTGNVNEARHQVILRDSYLASQLTLNVQTNSYTGVNTGTITLRKNGASATPSVAISIGITGQIKDVTHVAKYASGDSINLMVTSTSSTAFAFAGLTLALDATLGVSKPLLASQSSQGSTPTINATNFTSLYGGFGTITTSASLITTQLQHKFQSAGVISNFATFIITAAAAPFTVTVQKNGNVNVNQTLSITNGVTGAFEDVTHTDAVAAGDAFSVAAVIGATTAPSFSFFSSKYTSNTAAFDLIAGGNIAQALSTTADQFVFIDGGFIISTTETVVQIKSPISVAPGQATNLRVQVAGASGSQVGGVVTLRINGVSGNQTITMGTSSGTIQDLTHSDSFARDDLINYGIVHPTTAASTVSAFGMTIAKGITGHGRRRSIPMKLLW